MTKHNSSQYAIVVDSGCDMPKNFYDEHDVVLVPFHIRLGEEDMLDVPEAIPEDYYARFSSRRERVRTSQPSLAEYEDVYRAFIEQGYTKIISLHMSSELSGSYQTAVNAATVFSDEAEIAVVDTKLASAAEGLIVADLVSLRDDGIGYKESLAHIQRLISLTQLYFIPTQKNALRNKRKFDRGMFNKMHRKRDEMFGTRFLEHLSDDGSISTITGTKDISDACAQLARIMSKESQYLGELAYVKIHSHAHHALSFIDKPLDTNEFTARCVGVIEASPSISCYTGIGSIALAYVPVEALHNIAFIQENVW